MKPNDARKLSGEAQFALRVRAVEACELHGMTQGEAAEVLGVHRSRLNGWVQLYRSGGVQALAIKKRGRPAGHTKLTKAQAASIRRTIIDRTPEQTKMPFVLWTRAGVAWLIRERFGVEVSLSTVGVYLRRWNLSPQKPVRRALERDPQAVEAWLEHEYPAIRAQAKREGAVVLWGDECGMRSDHAAGRSWSPVGRTPVVDATGRRFSINMISALSNRGELYFRIFRGRFNGGVFLDFLKRLAKQASQPVYLIVDGHPAHRAASVRHWLEANAPNLRLFFLPAYSPELNPDELLNNDVKTNAVGRKPPATVNEMERNVRSHLHRRQKQPDIVARFFHEKHVRYAAQ